MKEFTLKDQATGKIRREDWCQIVTLTLDCDDMKTAVSDIYRLAGRI